MNHKKLVVELRSRRHFAKLDCDEGLRKLGNLQAIIGQPVAPVKHSREHAVSAKIVVWQGLHSDPREMFHEKKGAGAWLDRHFAP
jgi:hypothetical protein